MGPGRQRSHAHGRSLPGERSRRLPAGPGDRWGDRLGVPRLRSGAPARKTCGGAGRRFAGLPGPRGRPHRRLYLRAGHRRAARRPGKPAASAAMKIAIVSSFFLPVPPVRGGAMEKIWFRLGREFAARGHEVTLVSRTWPGFPEREMIDGIRILRVRGFNHTRRTWRNLALDCIWGLRVARRLPPGDIVACNTVTLPAHLFLTRPSAGRVVVVLSRMSKGHAH